jgi:hypothetical protein
VHCAVTIPPDDFRSLRLYYYAVCGRMCMSSVIQQFLRIIFFRSDLRMKCLTFRILDIMNIVEIILRNCCVTDDINM